MNPAQPTGESSPDRFRFEQWLQQHPTLALNVLESLSTLLVVLTPEGQIIDCNSMFEQVAGYPLEAVSGRAFWEFLPTLADAQEIQHHLLALQAQPSPTQTTLHHESEWLLASGDRRWIAWTHFSVFNEQGAVAAVISTGVDVTPQRQTESGAQNLNERSQQAELLLRLSAEMIRRVCQPLDLDSVLQIAVKGVREFLQVERVAIYQIEVNQGARFVVESLAPGCSSILNRTLYDPCFGTDYASAYEQGRVSVIADIYQHGLNPCYIELLERVQIRALLLVPIVENECLWGLLCAHQCSAPHHWQADEVRFLTSLANQIAIAIQQAERYQQMQQTNVELEGQVQERTTELERALHLEATLKRITDKVRDSLDESQILQTAVQELGINLGLECCDTGIYNATATVSRICYEYLAHMPSAQGQSIEFSESPVHSYLLEGQYLQFCFLSENLLRQGPQQHAILACPISDEQGVIGDLWLFKPRDGVFEEVEIRLVQQVANQCAIAIRQARLYQASQVQIQELEKLNQLKDEFLSSISHELRTPVSTMKMAIQMLGIALNQERPFLTELRNPQAERSRIAQYFQILQDECEREINLINDLLELQQLEAGNLSRNSELINLQEWLPDAIAPFHQRAIQQQQTLTFQLAPDLPFFYAATGSLRRILSELLDNACKYTPAGEQILIAVGVEGDRLRLEVSNSGAEIPPSELPQIFNKFHRVPSHDPWQQGGTGLGLALIKRLIERLEGTIEAESLSGLTRFIVRLPLRQLEK